MRRHSTTRIIVRDVLFGNLKNISGAFSVQRCHYLRMRKNRFHDAQLIRTPGWPLFFALCAALAIIIYMAMRMAR